MLKKGHINLINLIFSIYDELIQWSRWLRWLELRRIRPQWDAQTARDRASAAHFFSHEIFFFLELWIVNCRLLSQCYLDCK